MRIETSSPRIPLHRLKHPVKEKLQSPKSETGSRQKEGSVFYEAFERELLEKGAKKFKEWLEKFEIK